MGNLRLSVALAALIMGGVAFLPGANVIAQENQVPSAEVVALQEQVTALIEQGMGSLVPLLRRLLAQCLRLVSRLSMQ